MEQLQKITIRDIEMVIKESAGEEFIRFGIKDYDSLRQIASRFVARLRGKTVYSRKEYIEKLLEFSEVIYPSLRK
jgi:hypothetical protein